MLIDPLWLQILAYLSDIFTKLNELNLGLRLKSYFADQSLVDFWGSLKDIYCVSEIAIKYLLPFCTTDLCMSGFSRERMTILKTKHRHRLQLGDDLRLKKATRFIRVVQS